MSVTLLTADIKKLRASLSLTTASPALVAAAEGAKEPYRFVLKQVESRLDATLDWINSELLGK